MLGEITRLRVSTRRTWASPWFALICFGVVTTIAAGALQAGGPTAMFVTWGVLGGGALMLTGRFYRRAGRRDGITGRGRWAMCWSISASLMCFLAAAAVGRVSGREGAVLTSILVVFACYLALGAWQRRADASIAVAAAATPAVLLAALSAAPWLVELTFGGGLVAAGVLLRIRTVSA